VNADRSQVAPANSSTAPGGDRSLRTLTAVSIHNGDVSPGTYPAYPDADSGVRERAYRSFAERYGLDLETVLLAGEHGDLRSIPESAEDTSIECVEEPPAEQRETHSPEWLTHARRLYGG